MDVLVSWVMEGVCEFYLSKVCDDRIKLAAEKSLNFVADRGKKHR